MTDANGRAVLHGVPEGPWFATARRDALLYSSGDHDSQHPLLVPAEKATTVRLVEAYVTGIRVRGGELLHHQFDKNSSVFDPADTRFLQTVLQRLEQRWPGARFAFWLRSEGAIRLGVVGNRCGAFVIVNGRAPWKGTVEPARLSEFQGPLELDAAQLTRSDEFGTLVLRALDVGGDVTKGLAVTVGPGSDRELRLNRRIENGDEVTLPCGDYSLKCDEPFLQQLLPNGVTVARGSRCAIDLGVRLLTRCEIELVGPPTTSWVRLQHATLREPVDHRLHGRGTLAYWLPEGTVTATFFAHEGGASGPLSFAEQMSSVEVGHSAPVAVGGGTLATPQHVVLSPVARR
jgi:hypothetical protein